MSTTIHVAPELLASVDRRASELGMSRNRYICKALERAIEDEVGWSPRFRRELDAAREDPEDGRTLAGMVETITAKRTRKPAPEL